MENRWCWGYGPSIIVILGMAISSCSGDSTVGLRGRRAATAQPSSAPLGETSHETNHQRIPKVELTGSALRAGPRRVNVTELEDQHFVESSVFNPYTETTEVFGGVLLRDLVRDLAPAAQAVDLTAIDDYQVRFLAEEWSTLPIILVTRINNHHMPVADKGPVRIVIRVPQTDAALVARLKPKWIWQVKKIEFLDKQ